MSYKDLSKVIPDEKANTDFLDKIIDESDDNVSSSSSSSSSDDLPRMSSYAKAKPPKKEKPKEDNEDKKALIWQLKNWQASYYYLEEKKIEISKQLKDKVSKALSQGFDVKLSVLQALIDELKFSSGADITSPPVQADMILHGVNPLVENAAVSYGYDITGFSNVAAVTCKFPLVMALIENDIMCGKKPSPLLMLGLVYAQTLVAVYAQNKARKPLSPATPAAAAESTVGREAEAVKQSLPPLSDPPATEATTPKESSEKVDAQADF